MTINSPQTILESGRLTPTERQQQQQIRILAAEIRNHLQDTLCRHFEPTHSPEELFPGLRKAYPPHWTDQNGHKLELSDRECQTIDTLLNFGQVLQSIQDQITELQQEQQRVQDARNWLRKHLGYLSKHFSVQLSVDHCQDADYEAAKKAALEKIDSKEERTAIEAGADGVWKGQREERERRLQDMRDFDHRDQISFLEQQSILEPTHHRAIVSRLDQLREADEDQAPLLLIQVEKLVKESLLRMQSALGKPLIKHYPTLSSKRLQTLLRSPLLPIDDSTPSDELLDNSCQELALYFSLVLISLLAATLLYWQTR